MMCAYSLRTWRRNGVACDELLFLPGTPHGERHGVVETAPNRRTDSIRVVTVDMPTASEGDVAAGVGYAAEASDVELAPMNASHNNMQADLPSRARALSKESTLSSVQEFDDSWDDDDDNDDAEMDDEENGVVGRESADLISRSGNSAASANRTDTPARAGPVERFRENHPSITRFGSFFFFRSSTTSTQNAAYAPSGPMVVGAALDLSMPILFNFHLYIEAYNHIGAYGSETPAKILPLIFLSVLIVRSVIPPGRRGRFWGVVRYTLMAPIYPSRFRDSFVGDVGTSLVRPLQDVMFALSYYVTVIFGTLTGNYGLSESGEMLQSSWVLYNVILPSCALLPLWWKFLQTLRECYDTGKRWPHLGNAFKYLTASVLILYGMTHQEDRRSSWWYVCFALAVMYQIWWDVFMDWELIVIAPRQSESIDYEHACFTQTSSYPPDSRLLIMQRYIAQPVYNAWRWVVTTLPHWKQFQIRPRRLYKSESFYWKILAYNVVFRFTWMLCFIPAYHFSASGYEQYTTFSSDTNSYLGVLLPMAEILRRTLWGFLHLEMKTIRMQDGDDTSSYARLDQCNDEICEDSEMSQESSASMDSSKMRYLPAWLGYSHPLPLTPSGASIRSLVSDLLQTDNNSSHLLFKAELSLWAIAFVGLGLWATTY
jgi:EXS family